MPFNGAWIGVALGALLLLAPQLLLRDMKGFPLFGRDDDANILRMGRAIGLALFIIFGSIVYATSYRGR